MGRNRFCSCYFRLFAVVNLLGGIFVYQKFYIQKSELDSHHFRILCRNQNTLCVLRNSIFILSQSSLVTFVDVLLHSSCKSEDRIVGLWVTWGEKTLVVGDTMSPYGRL